MQISKIRSFRTRTVSTFVLIGSFLGFIWSGHVPLMFMIFCIQVSCTPAEGDVKADLSIDICINNHAVVQFAMVRELFRLAQKAQQEYAIEAEQRQGRRGLRKAKLGYSQQWYFFGVAAFWMYLRYTTCHCTVVCMMLYAHNTCIQHFTSGLYIAWLLHS